MEIKKIIILALSITTMNVVTMDQAVLEDLSSSLLNLKAKTDELNKISEQNYKKFYRKLRVAIQQSLIDKKYDTQVFKNLEEGPAKRTAQYLLEQLFEKKVGTNPYKISTTYEQIEGSTIPKQIHTFNFEPAGYDSIKVPLDNIVNQILLISRVVDHIVRNYKKDDFVTIQATDVFESIFYTFFANALSKERTSIEDQPIKQQLVLVILSDALSENDFNVLSKSIEETTDDFVYHKNSIHELLQDTHKYDIYLFNTETKLKTKPNIRKIINDADEDNIKQLNFSHFSADEKQSVAFVSANTPDKEREALFSNFITNVLKIPQDFAEEDIKEYKLQGLLIPYYYLPFIISKTREDTKNSSEIFILNGPSKMILDLYSPIIDWPDMLYELTLLLDPNYEQTFEDLDEDIKVQAYKFDNNSKQFIEYNESAPKKLKVKKITW